MSRAESSLERAVVEELGEKPGRALLGVNASAEQIDLKLDEARESGANVFRLLRQEPQAEPGGPGRRKGSRNKQSDDIAKLLAHKGIKDPVEYMGELYSTPLDQLCALALHADGTIERQARLDKLIDEAAEQTKVMAKRLGLHKRETSSETLQAAEELARVTDRLVELSAQRATKPGDVAIKLINAQLTAAKAVAEYWHSKRPVEAKVSLEALPTIVMPGAGSGRNFEQADQTTRLAGDLLAKALAAGSISPADLHGLEIRDGQLMIEGEFVEVEDGGDGEE